MSSANDLKDKQQRDDYLLGLKKVIAGLRGQGVKEFGEVANALSQYRREWLQKQDGIVTYNQTGPYDPLTNTAPGTADFLVLSSAKANQGAQFNLGGNSASRIQSKRPGGIQTGNNLALAKQGGLSNSSYSFISIA